MPDPTRATIAVVDDDPRVLESMLELLESAGHGVRLYASARALLEAGGASDFDCLITDVGMPGMDGFALRQLRRDRHPSLPVILMTGDTEFTSRRPEADCCGRSLFVKPFDGPKLLAALRAEIRAARRGG